MKRHSASQIGVSFPNTNFATDFFDAAPTTFTKHGNPDAIAYFARMALSRI